MANRLDGKDSARRVRIAKHNEAVARNERTAPDRRRQFWRDRGFTRQSQAASLIVHTVTDVNERAAEQRQRATDWDRVPTEITEQMI